MDSLMLRDEICCLSGKLYFNYAATAPLLKSSATAMIQRIQENREPLSSHFDSWLGELESARGVVAQFIGASYEEVAFTTSTSQGLSLIAGSIPWQRGDRVLYPADEFPSNRYVWQNLACKGVEAIAIAPHPEKSFLEQLTEMDLSQVKAVALSAISYLDGRRQPIPEIAAFCRNHQILSIVDAIQAVGAIPVNVKEWGCDLMASGGQKWLFGPVGSGFIYVHSHLINSLHPAVAGWASSAYAGDFFSQVYKKADGARCLEPGLPDLAAVSGLKNSLLYLQKAGIDSLSSRLQSHVETLRHHLSAKGHCLLVKGPWNKGAGIVALSLDHPSQFDFWKQLIHDYPIHFTLRKEIARFSPHACTTDQEMECLLDLIGSPKRSQQVQITAPIQPLPQKQCRHALVTGATGSLGRAFCYGLAKRGINLTIMATDQKRLEDFAFELEQTYAIRCTAKALNLSRSWGEVSLNEEIDLLINNAADALAAPFEDVTEERMKELFECNTFAPMQMTQRLLPFWRKRGYGGVINVVTAGARCTLPFFTLYSASKAALWSWSEGLQREWQESGIKVMTFLPPHMETNTLRRLGRSALSYFKRSKAKENFADPDLVAEECLKGFFNGQMTSCSWKNRLKIACNALFPNWISKRISKMRRK